MHSLRNESGNTTNLGVWHPEPNRMEQGLNLPLVGPDPPKSDALRDYRISLPYPIAEDDRRPTLF